MFYLSKLSHVPDLIASVFINHCYTHTYTYIIYLYIHLSINKYNFLNLYNVTCVPMFPELLICYWIINWHSLLWKDYFIHSWHPLIAYSSFCSIEGSWPFPHKASPPWLFKHEMNKKDSNRYGDVNRESHIAC